MKRVIECIETIIVEVAKKSVGKSIPIFSHKVEKPENIQKMIKNIGSEDDA